MGEYSDEIGGEKGHFRPCMACFYWVVEKTQLFDVCDVLKSYVEIRSI